MRAERRQGARFAVIDRVGTVHAILRRACPTISFRLARDRASARDSGEPLLVVAAYGPVDWDVVGPLARRRPTIVVSATRAREDPERAMSLGAFGYLDIELGPAALRRAMLGAVRGEPAYSRAAIGRHLRSELEATVLRAARASELTPRQREVVALIASGHSDKEIATLLGIATTTAQKHVTNVLRRLDVPNRAAAAVAVLGVVRSVTD